MADGDEIVGQVHDNVEALDVDQVVGKDTTGSATDPTFVDDESLVDNSNNGTVEDLKMRCNNAEEKANESEQNHSHIPPKGMVSSHRFVHNESQ